MHCFLRSSRHLPFTFYLLPFTFFFSCKRLPNIQGKGEVFLQGIWNQDSIANKGQLLNYTQHRFKFSCDSFYVDLTTYAKVNYYEADCFNKGVWQEYAKGTYKVKNDTLILIGDFTKANYKQKVSGCYRNGRYLTSFVIKQADSAQLHLENVADQRECVLNLKQKMVCIQKEL
jgi:hypothetical protein